MKDASQYSVSFPYGATTYPYGPTGYAGSYHRGDDRYMPDGAPVLVNGVQIGLSGRSGEVTGPHLHTGRFVGGKDTNPNKQGFSLPAPVKVVTVASDATNGNYVRLQDAQGVQWVYLHLSRQDVKPGQVLANQPQGETMTRNDMGAMKFLALRDGRISDPEYEKYHTDPAGFTQYLTAIQSENSVAPQKYSPTTVSAFKQIATRQDATQDEIDKYLTDMAGLATYLRTVQDEHGISPQPLDKDGYVKVGTIDGIGNVFKEN